MKLSGYTRSFPLLTVILFSTVAFGLFYTFRGGAFSTFRHTEQESFAPADSLQGKKKLSQDSLFAALLISSDKAITEKKYDKGLSDLEQALRIKPANLMVKDKIVKVKSLLAGNKQQDEALQKAIASGDAYFAVKDYLNAKSAYQVAIGLNANDPAAKEKLRKTMELLRSQKAQNTLFDVAVAGADKLFQEGDYAKAQQEYENASKLLPGDPYPKNKINEIIKILVDKQVKDEEFAKAVASGDKFYAAKNFQSSLLDFKKAAVLKPDEKYPQDKIKELTDILAAIKAKDDAYQKAVALGDQFFAGIQYPDAIKSYNEALVLKPEQAYPKQKIKEIEGIMARTRAAQADYDKYVALADSFYIGKKYLDARQNYLMASSVKPSEGYPKEMMSKADKMMNGQEAQMARELEEQYARTLADADKLLADLSYEPARAAYSKASNLKPSEKYPKDKIRQIDEILANALRDKEEQYKFAISTADKAVVNKVYETAKSEYEKALAIKPAEGYPKLKIAEVEKLIAMEAKQKAADARYANTIGKADSLLTLGLYPSARAEFQNALKMKPAEIYPKNRISEIDLALADLEKQKALDNQFSALIVKAEQMLVTKSYLPAKAEFGNALKLKPLEAYPKQKMDEIDKILADLAAQKAIDDRYLAIIAGADKLLASKSYDEARVAYQNAVGVKPAETYPKDKIAEIDRLLADMAALRSLDENYNAVIARADQLLAGKSYEPARTEYTSASALKPAEKYPKDKIAEIETILAAAAKQKALDTDYAATIGRGDKLLADKSYEPALAEYQAALKLKPAEEYPKGKIGEIGEILAGLEKQKSLEAQYAGLITKSDKLFTEKSYDQARADFVNASALKPQESYPKEKVTAIDKILADLAAAKALDDQYAGLIAGADKLLAAKTYEQARTEYLNAGKLKPTESYPAEKIAAIDKILADLAAAKSLDENYLATIASADRHLSEKNYEAAKTEYAKASGLKPAEKYPPSKIAEIDATLAAIAKQKATDDEYSGLIAKADKLLADKSYEPSKAQYQAALVLKPSEQYPKDKIAEIGKSLATLASIKETDDRYAASVSKADQLLAQKSYAPARTEYEHAGSIKPTEQYPKDKIAAIEKILADLAAAKALDEQYAGIIAGADKLLAAKTYEQARTEYLNAGKLKPTESYPAEKVAAIDKILADLAAQKTLDENYKAGIAKAEQQLKLKAYDDAKTGFANASAMKPAEEYPKTKIAEIDSILAAIARQKALDEEYLATVAAADKLLADKSYDQAKAGYQKAGGLKPAEQYPRTKLAEIEKEEADLARVKAIGEQYQAAIASADKLFAGKSYDQARTSYLEAGKIKPGEQYPKDKATEIAALLAAIQKQKALDDQFKAGLQKADQLLASKSYDLAKTEYLNAGKLKPDEQYPKDKITEIDGILAALKAQEDSYQASVLKADGLLAQKQYEEARTEYKNAQEIKPLSAYPKEKITEINKALEELMGKQKFYENLVANGDNLLKDKDYVKAKEAYQQALGVFPDKPYPKERITLITARLDSIYRANKSFYDKAIADADRFYNTFEFDKAVDAYTDAANFLPMENYPKEMITRIRKTIAENAIADVLKSNVTIAAGTEKQFPFPPVNVASRKNNFIYIKIKNLSGKPFNILMRYGKDKQANGGVVMKNVSLDGKVNERLVSVKDQDLWSREDNNWISLYPQGGDIEVSFIQVSRAK